MVAVTEINNHHLRKLKHYEKKLQFLKECTGSSERQTSTTVHSTSAAISQTSLLTRYSLWQLNVLTCSQDH